MKARTSRSALPALAVLSLTIAGMLGVLPSLATQDLNWCYPFMSPDSWDWLVNGLFWTGVPIAASFRPPGLPLIIALLHRFSALELLPYLNFAMLGLAAALLHRLVRLRHSRLVSALAVLLFVSNGSLFGYVRFIMAEVWTLPFLLGAALAFFRAGEQPKKYISCAVLLSVGFLFHYTAAIVGVAFGLALLLFRRETLKTRWPWLALLASLPLPALWVVLRALHNRSGGTGHDVEALFDPSFHNLRYFALVAVALAGLAVIPLYFAGFARLLPIRGSRLSPWAQTVLVPPLLLALFFTLLYDWADKRFLYYLFPFAAAVAAEGMAALVDYGRGGRLRAACATTALGLMLLWNRIPYPTGTHSLLALTPRNFLDAAAGIRTAQVRSVSTAWRVDLFTSDGFFDFEREHGSCAHSAEAEAVPALRAFLDARLELGEPLALASDTTDPTSYWIETNRLAVALERAVVLPTKSRFLVRRLHAPEPRALATFGPFELFDLLSISAAAPSAR